MNKIYTIILERYDRYEKGTDNDDLFQIELDQFEEDIARYATSCRIEDDIIIDDDRKYKTYTITIEYNSGFNDQYFVTGLDEFREKMAEYAKSCKVTEDVICR